MLGVSQMNIGYEDKKKGHGGRAEGDSDAKERTSMKEKASMKEQEEGEVQ